MGYGQLGTSGRIDRAWRKVAIVAAVATALVLAFADTSPRAAGNFTPTLTFETSTSRAAAHPDARITIDNSSSSEDIKDITIDLPDSFMGSLNAAEQCSVADAQNVTCGDESIVGSVINYATVDNSDVRLRGNIYLTEPLNSTDPAGLQIVVPATIGGVDMGNVVVNARAVIRYADPSPDWSVNGGPPDAIGAIRGLRTIVEDVPNEITDANNRTVEFSLKKLEVDLRSDQQAPYSKLLTNPSRCGDYEITANAVSYQSTGEAMSDDFTVDQCETVHVGDASLSFTPDVTTAATPISFSTSITFADDQPSVQAVKLQMPPTIGFDGDAFGEQDDQCPNSSIDQYGDDNVFNPDLCPSQALFGSVEIETPLLPEPIIGKAYFVDSAPIPNIGIYVDESTGPDNPAGVEFGVIGYSSTDKLNSNCPSSGLSAPPGGCKSGIAASFGSLPDIPLKSITVVADGISRPRPPDPPLDGKFLRFASATDVNCQPDIDFAARFVSHVDEAEERPSSALSPLSITGCDARTATLTASPFGEYSGDNPPNSLTYSSAATTAFCAIDTQVTNQMTACNPVAGTGTFTPGSSLDPGIHYFYARTTVPTAQYNHRAFGIPVDPPTDTDAPTAAIDSGPTGTTADTTPEWTFSADEDSFFQCAIDDGAFLPCDPNAAASTSGSFEVPTADAFFAGTSHKFAVRAQDEYGNVSAAQEATIDVEIDFGPSLDVDLSTTQARAHPDLDVTIQSNSGEDMKSVKLAMPDGFFGGLTGVGSLCPIATANAGNCTSASQVGTVETEARVDDSLIRIDGQVYLTESAHFGEPAGLSIKVPAVIQDVDLGNIIVAGRLQVRGQAEGIDSLVIDIPDRITPNNPPYNDGETEFDMRKIALKLRTGSGASHPLLTNPSSCNGSAFVANFGGYSSSATTESSPFAATGCEALGFSPSLSLSVIDADTGQAPGVRSDGKSVSANLSATLTANPGEASIRDVSILMPRPLTINVLEIPIACTVAQYADGAGQCPESSKVGSVSAVSPLLPEPLTGTVYLLKQSDPARAVPRMLLALRGRINIDIIADNRFENLTQIRTIFTNLPDVPLSSFTMKVDRVLSTRNEACTVPADEWGAVGQMVAANGKSVPISQPLTFGCKPKYSFRYRKRAKKTTLNVTAVGGPVKLRRVNVSLPKRVVTIKRGLKRKLIVRADGKKLSRRCYKVGKTSIKVTLCGRSVGNVAIQFRSGSLSASRKAPVPKRVKSLRISGTDSAGKRVKFSR